MIKLSLSLPLEALAACRFASNADISPEKEKTSLSYSIRQNTNYVGIKRKAVGPKLFEFHLYATDGHRLTHVWWPAQNGDVLKAPNNEVYFKGNRVAFLFKEVIETLKVLNQQIVKLAKEEKKKPVKESFRDYTFLLWSDYEKLSRENRKNYDAEQLKQSKLPDIYLTVAPPGRDSHLPVCLDKMDPDLQWFDADQVIPRYLQPNEKTEVAIHVALDGNYLVDFVKYLNDLRKWLYCDKDDSCFHNAGALTFYYRDPNGFGPLLIKPNETAHAVRGSIEHVLMPMRRD